MKRVLFLCLLVLAIGAFVFTGCAQQAPAPAPAPKSAAPAAPPTAAPPAAAASAADFYKSNTVTLIAPFKAGAGSDFACRLFASYWPDVSGGGAMIIKNMDGGGGLVGTNFVAAAKPDGLTLCLGNTTSAVVTPAILKDPALKFDPSKQTWLGSIFDDPNMAAITKSLPYDTIDDIKKAKGLKFGAVGPSGAATIGAAVIAEGLGLQEFKIVTGYTGGADLRLAISKKEIDGFASPINDIALAAEQGTAKQPFMILQRERLDLFPKTPTFYEVVKDASPEQQKLFDSAIGLTRSFRALFAPPGLPPDKVKFLREAFTKIANMPAFKSQSAAFFPVWTKPLTGEELTPQIDEYMKIDGTKIKAMINKYLAVK